MIQGTFSEILDQRGPYKLAAEVYSGLSTRPKPRGLMVRPKRVIKYFIVTGSTPGPKGYEIEPYLKEFDRLINR